MFEPTGLHVMDAHGNRVQFVKPAGENAPSGIGCPTMQIRPADDAVMLSELEVNLGVRAARHDRDREVIEVDRNVVPVSFRFRYHAAEQLEEEQVNVQHLAFAKMPKDAVAADRLTDRQSP